MVYSMGRLSLCVVCLAILLSGCGAKKAAPSSGPATATLAMGFFPGVQFAPFYVAQARGYYRKAGLNLRFRYGIEPDILRLASTGKVDFANAGGDEVLAAAAQGLHVRFVMSQYARFPAALFSLASTGITSPAALRGHTIGVPGKYGASYVGLLALLEKAGVPQSAVTIESIGFSQSQSVSRHKVDAAMGYANNEPILLKSQGLAVNEIDIYRYANLAGAGLATGNTEIAKRPAVVRALVTATLHGLSDTLRDPNAAFRITEAAVPSIKAQAKVQRAVLMRTLDFWRAEPGHPLGWVDPAVWNMTARYLYQFKQIPHPVSPGQFYTNTFVPAHSS